MKFIFQHELPYYNAMVQTIKMLGGKNSEEDAKDILDLEKEISKVINMLLEFK